MDRRTMLATFGVAGFSTLAGCGSDSATDADEDSADGEIETTSGPAAFDDIRVVLPDQITVDQAIAPTVSVANVGGEAGDYSDTLTITEGNKSYSESVSIEGVQPGSRESVELPSVTFTNRDAYVFELEDAQKTERAAVEPKTAAIGESVELVSGIRATYDALTFPFALVTAAVRRGYSNRLDRVAVDPPTGKVFAVMTVNLENTGTMPVEITPAEFSPANGAMLTNIGSRPASTSVREAALTETLRIEPAQTVERELLIQFDREPAASGVTVGFQRDRTTKPPEVEFRATPEGNSFNFPAFELVSTTPPEPINTNETRGTFQFTIKNTGSAASQFVGAVVWKDGPNDWNSDSLASPDVFREEISPGETRTYQMTWDGGTAATGSYPYRVSPFDEAVEVVFE